MVFQDKDNDFQGTSDASTINYARSSFHVLDQAVRRLAPAPVSASNTDGHSPSGPSAVAVSSHKSVGTAISSLYAPDEGLRDSLQAPERRRLGSMSHVITVIIPLLLTNPITAANLASFTTISIFTNLERERDIQHD